MSKEKQRDEAGQFGGVYGSKNKAVREKATRDLLKKLGIKMPSPGTGGRMISDSDLKLLEKMVEGGFATGVSDLIARITKKNYTEKQKNKKGKIESDFLSGKNKMGGGKIKKNYSKGGGVRPTSY